MTEPPADILRRLRPIPTDRRRGPAFDVEGVDPSGAPVSVEVVGATAPVLLLFLSADCIGCRDLWEGLSEFETGLAGVCRVAVVTRGPGSRGRVRGGHARSLRRRCPRRTDPAHVAESQAPTRSPSPEIWRRSAAGDLAGDLAGDRLPVVMSTSAYVDYRVEGPPFYAVVGPVAVLGEGVAWGVDATLQAVRSALVASG